MRERDHGFHANRVSVSYWDALGNETVRYFAADVPAEDIPETIDCPTSGLLAGRDQKNPPPLSKLEPYKTHLAYVKERRTEAEGEQLLADALQRLRVRRGTAPAAKATVATAPAVKAPAAKTLAAKAQAGAAASV